MNIEPSNAIMGDIQFPRNKDSTNILSFGDLSNTSDVEYTRKFLEEKISGSDSLVFLGDQGYDLFEENGEVGNDFLCKKNYFLNSLSSKKCLRRNKNFKYF